MKNIIKNINILIISVILAVFFIGCSNLSEGNSKSHTAYTVSGAISVGSALPSSVAEALQSSTSSARTASSLFSEPDSVKFTVTAMNNEEVSISVDVKKVDGEYKYELELSSGGEWNLTASMKSGDNIILSGESSITASESNTIQNIIVNPDITSGTGVIKLPVSDKSNKINKVKYVAEPLGMMIVDDPEEIQRRHFEGEVQFSDGKADVEINNVPAGCYEFTFSFDDSAGNTLYSCMEAVNVFNTFETDSWVGESAYIKDGVFSVTDDLISRYGTQVVQSSPYVFRNYEGTFYMTGDDSAVSSMSSMTSLNYQDSYCFDTNGYYYVFSSSGEIISNNGIVNGKSPSLPQNDYKNYWLIDSTKNILYSYYINDINESQLYLTKYPTMLSEGTESTETTKQCTISLESFSVIVEGEETTSSPLPVKCIINDDVIYVIARDSGYQTLGSYIYHGTFEDGLAEKSLPASSKAALNFESLDYRELSITDSIYQDGKIYILFKDSVNSGNANETRSHGGVLVYDCFSNKIASNIIGWTSGSIFKTSSGGSVTSLTPIESLRTAVTFNGNAIYETESFDDPVLYTFTTSNATAASYSFYTPFDNLSSCFAGPEKIVAIKPKKLVIFDNGRAFYTDADGVVKSKTLRRIVYVDLESLSIIDSIDTDVQNASSYPGIGGANFFESVPEDAAYYYHPNAAGFQPINVTTSGSYGATFINRD